MKTFFAGVFMMLACLALAMIGGEPQGDADQVWTCTGLMVFFALCLYMTARLAPKEEKK